MDNLFTLFTDDLHKPEIYSRNYFLKSKVKIPNT